MMTESQVAERMPSKEPSFFPEESLQAEAQPPYPMVSDEKTDTEQPQEAVTKHSEAVVEQDGCIGLPLESQVSTSSNSSTEPGSAMENAVTTSLELLSPPSSGMLHISKEKQDSPPAQLEDDSSVIAGEFVVSTSVDTVAFPCRPVHRIPSPNMMNMPKEMNIVPRHLNQECSADFLDVQINKARINADSTASNGREAASLPPEEYHSTSPDSGDTSNGIDANISCQFEGARLPSFADAQINKKITVNEISKIEDRLPLNYHHHQNYVQSPIQMKTSESDISIEHLQKVTENRGFVDTTTPFESVREAVTKFGGIVDWKAHKALNVEKHNHIQYELKKVQEGIPTYRKNLKAAEVAKAEVLKELDTTKRLVEELKLNLEIAQTEEAQAQQDAELAQLRAKEMEDGIADEVSVAAKAQLEFAKSRHEARVAELKSVKGELTELQGQCIFVVGERDIAMKKAEGAHSASKELEKEVEGLTLELITVKDSLESSHAAHIEAEEHRMGAALARDQDFLNWDKEIKQAQEELYRLNEQLLQAKDLKEKLKEASSLLAELKKELAAYMDSQLKEQSESLEEDELKDDLDESKEFQLALALKKKELEEVKANVETVKNEVSILRVAECSLNFELEREKAGLASMRQREGMASIAVSSLETEIERKIEEIKQAVEKEKEAREKMVELPKLLQQAALEADQLKSSAKMAREELRKVIGEAEHIKTTLSTTEIRLQATLMEIEAARGSESLALAAVKALQESEEAAAIGESPQGVTLPLEEYFTLSKKAHEAEEFANERITSATAQIQAAKESELNNLQRLEEAYREMDQRKEALRVAIVKSDKAKEGKLGVEQELRKWRAKHEQRRRSSGGGRSAANPPRSPPRNSDSCETKTESKEAVAADVIHPTPGPKIYVSGNKMEHAVPEFKQRKKNLFFPHMVLFLAKKRAQSRK